jgi:hypothetical protein
MQRDGGFGHHTQIENVFANDKCPRRCAMAGITGLITAATFLTTDAAVTTLSARLDNPVYEMNKRQLNTPKLTRQHNLRKLAQ